MAKDKKPPLPPPTSGGRSGNQPKGPGGSRPHSSNKPAGGGPRKPGGSK